MASPGRARRVGAAALLALGLIAPTRAETPAPAPPPDPERARRLSREAVTLYGLAIFQQRQDRLVSAAQTLEEAVRLDPAAVPPRLALVPLYCALGRPDDAARAAAAVLVIDPSQADTWRALARLLHDMRRTPEAVAVLGRCVATPQLADRPADLIAAHRDLGRYYAALGAQDRAAGAYRQALRLLAEHRAALEAKGVEENDLNRERADLSEGLGAACLAARLFTEARAAVEQARASYRLAGDTAAADRLTAQLAAAHAGLGETAQANALLDNYLRGRPRDLDAYALKARLLRDAGGGGSVPQMMAAYVQGDPDFLELQILLGDECRRLGDRIRAEAAYGWVVARKADVAAYRGLFAVLTGPGGSPQRLFALVDGALRRADPGDDGKPRDALAAAHVRAMTLALRQEPAAAGALLNAAVAELRQRRRFRDPDTLKRSHYLWWMLGGIAERAGQLATAEELFRTSLSLAGPDQEDSVYAALLRVLWAKRDRRGVIELCEGGLERANTLSLVRLHANLARAKAQLGQIEAALKHADLAVKLASDANRLNMRLRRVYVLFFAERFPEAEAECQKLLQELAPPGDDGASKIKLTGDEAAIRRELSLVYSTQRRFDKAEEQLRMILELDPSDAGAHNDLGYQLADQDRNLDEAERLVRRALELDRLQKGERLEDEGGNAAYLDSLGWVLFRRGRLAEARELLEQAVALPEGAHDPVVWDHLGDVRARLEQPRDAAAAWSAAQNLYRTEKRSLHDPRGEEVARKLKRLKVNTR
jgi:tetratricopeptide (TPR) repeat protein